MGDTEGCRHGAWQPWTACTRCDAYHSRTRHLVQPLGGSTGQGCALTAVEELAGCQAACRIQLWCRWGLWEDWSSCSQSCDQGRRSRRRHLELVPPPAPQQEASKPAALWADDLLGQSRPTSAMEPGPLHRLQHGATELLVAFFVGGFSITAVVALSRRCNNWGRIGGVRRCCRRCQTSGRSHTGVSGTPAGYRRLGITDHVLS